MYSAINSWLDKFLKLKNNYSIEIKNIISESNFSQKVTNHTVKNYSGKILKLYRNTKDNMREHLINLNPNSTFDINYLEDSQEVNIYRFTYFKAIISTYHKPLTF